MFKHILVATDGTTLAQKAEDSGVELASRLGARLTFITVRMPFYVYTLEASGMTQMSDLYDEESKTGAQKILNRALDAAKTSGVIGAGIDVESEYPFEAINSAAKNMGCDLIVMASHGRRGISALLLGSETVKVLTHSTVPVLVCR